MKDFHKKEAPLLGLQGSGGGSLLNNYNHHGHMEHVLVEQGGTVKTSNFTPTNTWS